MNTDPLKAKVAPLKSHGELVFIGASLAPNGSIFVEPRPTSSIRVSLRTVSGYESTNIEPLKARVAPLDSGGQFLFKGVTLVSIGLMFVVGPGAVRDGKGFG